MTSPHTPPPPVEPATDPPPEAPEAPEAVPAVHDSYAALRGVNYRRFLCGNVISNLGMQMQSVAIGYEIYERTRSPMALGIVGLVQVAPVLGLALPAGHAADLFSRRRIVMTAETIVMMCSLTLVLISRRAGPLAPMAEGRWDWNFLWSFYGCLLAMGVARSFLMPARQAMLPQIVPREHFSNAVTWNSSGFQLAAVLGPALGGLAIAKLGIGAVYIFNAVAAAIFFLALVNIRLIAVAATAKRNVTLRSLVAGFHFVWNRQLILSTITLDMFAVLLGGATALMPIFASEDYLNVGAEGLGWLRSAPFAGALLMSVMIAHRPPFEQAGKVLLWSVAGFGAATIFFGIAWMLPMPVVMTLVALSLLGAFDTVSVVVRHTLVQVLTPDEMRGRVSAVNGMFIGASNELGEFESGVTAHWMGPTIAVVFGGVGTLVVVALVAWRWPAIRRYGRLGSPG